MMICANLTAGGFSKETPCIYLLTLCSAKKIWRYVGRTGTSNKTGISSPYQRLAKHLAKAGKTQSCIWDSPCFSPEILNCAKISFKALLISKEKDLKQAEKWLRWHFSGKCSLNKEKVPKSEPKISDKLRSRLLLLEK